MTRVVVHVGSQRVASDAVPRGLYANREMLASHGVLVPQAGRHEMSPQAVRHHLLAWSFDPGGDHPYDPGVWEAMAEEVRAAGAPTVLLSSDLLAAVAADEKTAPALRDRLLGLSDDVTVAYLAREPLTLLNSLYRQRVRALEITCDFPSYLVDSPDRAFGRLADSFAPWLGAGDVRFVARAWGDEPDEAALPTLLELCEIDVPAAELAAVERTERQELGAVGVEATRVLGSYLRGRFPDFSFGEQAARMLRRRVAAVADTYGWNTGDFWGWAPEQARDSDAEFRPSLERFAQRAWGGPWPLDAPVERQRNVASLDSFTPQDANRLHHYVAQAVAAFERLRARELHQ